MLVGVCQQKSNVHRGTTNAKAGAVSVHLYSGKFSRFFFFRLNCVQEQNPFPSLSHCSLLLESVFCLPPSVSEVSLAGQKERQVIEGDKLRYWGGGVFPICSV